MTILAFILLFLAGQTDVAREAQSEFDHGHYEQAEKLLSRAVRINPNDPALWFYLGVSYSQLNQIDHAINAFEKTRELAPKKADVDFNLGLLYWRRGDVGKAKDAYRAGLEIEADRTSALQNYALLLMKTGEPDKAIAPLKALKTVPELSLPSRVSLIDCYIKLKEQAQLASEVDEVLQPGVAPAEQQTEIAAMLLEANEPMLAEKLLRSSLQLDTHQAKAQAALGVILMNRRQFEVADRSLKTAVDLQPDSEEFAMAYAECLLLWNRPTTMLVFLKNVKPKFEASSEYRYKLALAYYGVQEFSNAVETLEDLLKENPRRQDQIYYILGNCYFTMGNFEKSEASFRKAIELNPKEPDYYENLATLLRKQGSARLDEAIAQLNKAAEFERSGARVEMQLGLSYEAKGDWKDAAANLQKVIAAEPGLVPAHVALARVYFHLGRKVEGAKEKAFVASLEQKKQQERLNPNSAAAETIVDDHVQ